MGIRYNTCINKILVSIKKKPNKMYHIIDMSPFLLRRNRDQMIE